MIRRTAVIVVAILVVPLTLAVRLSSATGESSGPWGYMGIAVLLLLLTLHPGVHGLAANTEHFVLLPALAGGRQGLLEIC